VTCTLLFFTPAVVPVMFTAKVHEPFAGSVAPARLIADEPSVEVMVPPPQVPDRALGVATISPDGNESVNATPVSATELAAGLVMVNEIEVEPFSGMDEAPNDVEIDDGEATLRLADAVLPVPPLVDVTTPVVLERLPEAVPVTFTEKVHELLAASVAAVRLTEPEAAVDTIVPPPQLPLSPLGDATTRPAGNVSVKCTPLSETVFAAGLVMVKVSEVVPLSEIEGAPKDLLMVGGAKTVMLAEAVPPVPPSVEVTAPVVLF